MLVCVKKCEEAIEIKKGSENYAIKSTPFGSGANNKWNI